jgi:uncharacterized membrane protein required for colicin V production
MWWCDISNHLVDTIIVVLLLLCLLLGVSRGGVLEFLHFVGLSVTFIVSIMFYQPLSKMLMDYTILRPTDATSAIAFLIIASLTALCMLFISSFFISILRTPIKEASWPFLGGLLGFLRGALFVCLIVLGVSLCPTCCIKEIVVHESFIGNAISKSLPEAKNLLGKYIVF